MIFILNCDYKSMAILSLSKGAQMNNRGET